MESSELALYRGLGAVRNYGILVLGALFALNAITLGALNWFETNDLRAELSAYSAKLPDPKTVQKGQLINLPEDILSFPVSKMERVGFYEIRIVDKEYLAYANQDKNYVLMKSEESIKHETQNFALALFALYLGELVLLLGWWFFIRTKVREMFETI